MVFKLSLDKVFFKNALKMLKYMQNNFIKIFVCYLLHQKAY